MAWLRSDPVEPERPAPPPPYDVCVVPEWLDAEERAVARDLVAATSPAGVGDDQTALAMVAWRRWRRARDDWAAEHGIDPRQLTDRAPTWRRPQGAPTP